MNTEKNIVGTIRRIDLDDKAAALLALSFNEFYTTDRLDFLFHKKETITKCNN